MNGIIYKVTNLVNGKIYIGQTTQTLEYRKYQHYYRAKKLNKINHKRNYFQNALIKYSKNFNWEIIDTANTLTELNHKEELYISLYKSNFYKLGYNSTSGGDSRRLTQKVRKKISENTSGINNPFFGKKHSEETRNKIKKARKKQVITDEHRRKISENHRNQFGSENSMYRNDITKDKILELLDQGLSIRKIVKELNTSFTCIYSRLNCVS